MNRRTRRGLVSEVLSLPPLSVLAIGIALGYLGWRVLATAAGARPVTFVVLLAAEIFGVVRLVVELVSVGAPEDRARSAATGPPGTARPTAPASTVIVVVDDEPLRTVRAAILSALAVDRVGEVAVIDIHDRIGVADLARRLGATHHGVDDSSSVAQRATALAAVATRIVQRVATPAVVVLPADHVVLPDAARVLGARVAPGIVDAVTGRTDEVNAIRRVDRTGLGDNELWDQHIAQRLSNGEALGEWRGVALIRRGALKDVGGFSSADGRTLTHTAATLLDAGRPTVMVGDEVARRLAPGPRRLGLHRYGRDLESRLRRRRTDPLPRLNTLAGISARAGVINPARAIQRLALLAVAWTVLLGWGSPLVAPAGTLVVALTLRHVSAVVARRVAAGDAFEPWIVNDLRVMACDLEVGLRSFSRHWRPPPLTHRPPGTGPASVVVHGAQTITCLLVLAVSTGFVRVADDRAMVTMATLGCAWFLSAVMVARRSVARRQFRRNYRTDAELAVIDDDDLVVVGMDPVSAAPAD